MTQRLLTNDGDIAEDRVVTAAGSYSASAPLSSAGPWVMQMVAFRAAGSAFSYADADANASTVPAALTYVQGNYATPQSSQTSVPVTYTAAQNAGDLNVVIVGWNDATTQVKSLTDSKGNVYQLAVGPTVLTGSNPRVTVDLLRQEHFGAPGRREHRHGDFQCRSLLSGHSHFGI